MIGRIFPIYRHRSGYLQSRAPIIKEQVTSIFLNNPPTGNKYQLLLAKSQNQVDRYLEGRVKDSHKPKDYGLILLEDYFRIDSGFRDQEMKIIQEETNNMKITLDGLISKPALI
jgi:hypothetical protein